MPKDSKAASAPDAPKKRETPPAVQSYLDNIRKRSVRDLVKEDLKAEKPEEKETIEEEKKEEKEEKADIRLQTEEQHQKELEEIKAGAKEAAKEVVENTEIKSLKEEIAQIKEQNISKKEREEKIEEARIKWSAVDKETGKLVPKDYDEIVAEARRIALDDFKAFYKEQKEAELKEMEKVKEEETKKQLEQEKENQERVQNINQRINEEMEELYSAGKLNKPKDINDKNDPDAQRVNDLFQQAAAENEERRKAGKPLIDSISKFYFLYYKEKQPAGAEAPISGSRITAPEEEKLNYARDIHNPSFKQILYRAQSQLKRMRNQ